MAEAKESSGLPQEEPQDPDLAEMLTEGVRELLGASPEMARAWSGGSLWTFATDW